MPQFGHQDGFDTVAYITGPTHVLLGLRFGDMTSAPLELIKRPRIGACEHCPLDERRIAQSIHAGVADANAETGARLTVTHAFYVEDDSSDYKLFLRCAYLLASRRGWTPE